jgi:hypothetical protein
LRKSNSSATAIRKIRTGRPSVASTELALPYTCSITIELISLATSSNRSDTFSRCL